MNVDRRKINKIYFVIFFILIFFLFFYFFNSIKEKDKEASLQNVTVNLLTSVHPNLSWSFRPIKSKLNIKPGEVTTVEYEVENLEKKESTGIATFQYFLVTV